MLNGAANCCDVGPDIRRDSRRRAFRPVKNRAIRMAIDDGNDADVNMPRAALASRFRHQGLPLLSPVSPPRRASRVDLSHQFEILAGGIVIVQDGPLAPWLTSHREPALRRSAARFDGFPTAWLAGNGTPMPDLATVPSD